jgi:hypothetical protein
MVWPLISIYYFFIICNSYNIYKYIFLLIGLIIMLLQKSIIYCIKPFVEGTYKKYNSNHRYN